MMSLELTSCNRDTILDTKHPGMPAQATDKFQSADASRCPAVVRLQPISTNVEAVHRPLKVPLRNMSPLIASTVCRLSLTAYD